LEAWQLVRATGIGLSRDETVYLYSIAGVKIIEVLGDEDLEADSMIATQVHFDNSEMTMTTTAAMATMTKTWMMKRKAT
jgi:hypothetical protein